MSERGGHSAEEERDAISEILRIMATTPASVEPVFKAVCSATGKLCGAELVGVFTPTPEGLVYVPSATWRSAPPPATKEAAESLAYSVKIRLADRTSWAGRAFVEGRSVHIEDILTDPEIHPEHKRVLGWMIRTALAVPLRSKDEIIGVLSVSRSRVAPFSAQEIRLAETFADQAAIAIKNVKLFETVERQRSELRQFISPQVAELVTSPEGHALLDGHRREITVLHAGLRNFTAFIEAAEPEEIMSAIRAYHAAVGPVVTRSAGTIGHSEGDRLTVFFNDPVPLEGHALRAVETAIAMRDSMAELHARWRRLGYEMGLGCGIATGYATLGRIGFEGRYDYGAVGGVTDLAARLASEAKPGQIVLSQRSLAQADDAVEAEPVGEIAASGNSRPQQAYKVVRLKERPTTSEPATTHPAVLSQTDLERRDRSLLALEQLIREVNGNLDARRFVVHQGIHDPKDMQELMLWQQRRKRAIELQSSMQHVTGSDGLQALLASLDALGTEVFTPTEWAGLSPPV